MGVSATPSHVALLLLLPGFALHPPDYERLVRRLRVPCHVVDLWPRDLDALRDIGKPGSDTFEAWIEARVAHCRTFLHDPKACVVFAHSAGAEVGRRLGVRRLVTFGSHDDDRVALDLRGMHDTLVPFSPKARAVASSHFGCVPLEAAARCAGVQMSLMQRGVWLEPHVDGVDAIAAAVHAWLEEEERA